MDRKEIVKILGEHFGVKPKYLGVPSFDYEIETEVETFTVDREGRITTKAGEEVELEEILDKQEVDYENLEIAFPLDGHTGISLRNLVHMIYSRQDLIKKAFELEENIIELELVLALSGEGVRIDTIEDFKIAIEDLEERTHQRISFDFDEETFSFKLLKSDGEKIKAYAQFISLLNKKSKELKYASAKTVATDNEKYTFRTWLMRLGMIGEEYKATRKILLENLSGNTAFRKVEVKDSHE